MKNTSHTSVSNGTTKQIHSVSPTRTTATTKTMNNNNKNLQSLHLSTKNSNHKKNHTNANYTNHVKDNNNNNSAKHTPSPKDDTATTSIDTTNHSKDTTTNITRTTKHNTTNTITNNDTTTTKIQQAIQFWNHPSIYTIPTKDKIQYLKSKGLSQDDLFHVYEQLQEQKEEPPPQQQQTSRAVPQGIVQPLPFQTTGQTAIAGTIQQQPLQQQQQPFQQSLLHHQHYQPQGGYNSQFHHQQQPQLPFQYQSSLPSTIPQTHTSQPQPPLDSKEEDIYNNKNNSSNNNNNNTLMDWLGGTQLQQNQGTVWLTIGSLIGLSAAAIVRWLNGGDFFFIQGTPPTLQQQQQQHNNKSSLPHLQEDLQHDIAEEEDNDDNVEEEEDLQQVDGYQYPYTHRDHEFLIPPDNDNDDNDNNKTTQTELLVQHVQELSQALQTHVSNQERIMNKLSNNMFNTGTARDLTNRSMDLLRNTSCLKDKEKNENNHVSAEQQQEHEILQKNTTTMVWAQLVEIRAELTTLRTLQSLHVSQQDKITDNNKNNSTPSSEVLSSELVMTKKLDTVLDQLSECLESIKLLPKGNNNEQDMDDSSRTSNTQKKEKDDNDDQVSLSKPPSSPSLKSTASTASTATTTPHAVNQTSKDTIDDKNTIPTATTTSKDDTSKEGGGEGGKGNVQVPCSSSFASCSTPSLPLSLHDAIYKIATENDLPTIKTGTQLLYLYCVNLSSKPKIPRYRKVYTCNDSFRNKVEKMHGSMDLLYAVGFVNKGNHVEWGTSSSSSPKTKKNGTNDDVEEKNIILLKQAAAALSVLKSQAGTIGSNESTLDSDNDDTNGNNKRKEASLTLAKAALAALPPCKKDNEHNGNVAQTSHATVPTSVQSIQTPSNSATDLAIATGACATETPCSSAPPTPLAMRSNSNHPNCIIDGSNHRSGINLTSPNDVLTPDPGRFIVSPPDTKKHSYLSALSGFPDGPLELLDDSHGIEDSSSRTLPPPPPIAKESPLTKQGHAATNEGHKPNKLNLSAVSDDSSGEDMDNGSTRLLFSSNTTPSEDGKP